MLTLPQRPAATADFHPVAPPKIRTPDRADESLPRRAFVVSLYFFGLLLAVAMAAVSSWQFIVWTDAFFLESGTWGDLMRWFLSSVSAVYSIRWVVLLHYVILEFFDEQRIVYEDPSPWPFVSIFLPGYNEEESIGNTIESMLHFDYPNYEIIVIDDGSKDRTYELAKKYEGQYSFGEVRVVTKPNGGKWTAHNYAFPQAKGDLILCVDADGYMDADSLQRAVRRLMADPRADAVAGYTRVYHRATTICNLQALEFVLWNGALRQPQSRHGAVMCIPGPLGLFRKSAMQRVYDQFGKIEGVKQPGEYDGPFEGDTFAEDFDLTLAIQMTGGRVIYDRFAGCHTDCPDTMFALLNQRYRWSRGSIQVVTKVFSRCWKYPQYRNWRMLNWLFASYIYDMAVFMFAFVAYLSLTCLTLLGQADISLFAGYIVFSIIFKLVIGIPFIIDHREDLRLLIYLPLIDIYGTFVLGGAFVISLIDEIFKKKMRW
jgi:poly-beta-1,6-N-acetyl-D-glucosamine synthase